MSVHHNPGAALHYVSMPNKALRSWHCHPRPCGSVQAFGVLALPCWPLHSSAEQCSAILAIRGFAFLTIALPSNTLPVSPGFAQPCAGVLFGAVPCRESPFDPVSAFRCLSWLRLTMPSPAFSPSPAPLFVIRQ